MKPAEQIAEIAIQPGEVHIWRASLDVRADRLTVLASTLTEEEQARAARYIQEINRAWFSAGRGFLREVLSRYTGIAASDLRFRYGTQGKPELSSNEGRLQFNVSHSDQHLMIAVAQGRQVGIDVEHIRSLTDMNMIAARFFSARENSILRDLLPPQRMIAFYHAWTRKEAILKAYGEGISEVLDSVEVTLAPGEYAALLSIRGSTEEAARWSLASLEAPPKFAAALAIEGADVHIIDHTIA